MTQTTKIRMERDKECKGSVRFAAPKWQPGAPTLAVDNVYVSRQTPGIETARAVLVTVEVMPS